MKTTGLLIAAWLFFACGAAHATCTESGTQVINNAINPATESGTDLATDLNNAMNSLIATSSGSSRPCYAVAGTIWINPVSSTYVAVNVFDGTDDLAIASYNPTTHVLSLADSLPANVGIGTTNPNGYALNVQQAGNNTAYFGSTGSNQATVVIDDRAGGNNTALQFSDGGVPKWVAFVNGSSGDDFNFADSVHGHNFITAGLGASIVLGYAQTTIISSAGVVSFGSHSIGNTGFSPITDGLIVQYGSVTSADGSSTSVSFPVTFPNNFLSISGAEIGWGGSSQQFINGYYVSNPSASGFTLINHSNGTNTFTWIALGN